MKRTLLAVVVAILLGAVSPASAQDSITLDDLYDLYEVADIPADFVIALDTSGSMSDGEDPLYPRVVDALEALVEAIPEGDHVSLLTFDEAVTREFEGDLDTSSRAQVIPQLPPSAEGGATDIGTALEASLSRLERPRAARVQVVLLLTDGSHQPPDGSPYPQSLDAPAWQELRDRAAALQADRRVTAYGVGLSGGGATDVEPLRRTFSGAEIVDLPPEQLPSFFEELVERARIERLRSEVESDLESAEAEVGIPESVEVEADETVIPVDVSWEQSRLPATVTVRDVVARDEIGATLEVKGFSPESFRMEPGSHQTVDVTVATAASAGSGLDLGQEVSTSGIQVDLDLAVVANPDAILRDTVRVDPEARSGVASAEGSLTTTSGVPWWLAILVLVLLLAGLMAVVWFYLRHLRRPPLTGALQFEDGTTIVLSGTSQDIPERPGEIVGAGSGRLRATTRRGEPGRVYVSSASQPVAISQYGPWDPLTDETRLRYHQRVKIDQAEAEYVRN